VLPTRLIASDELRGTQTEVLIRNLQINPPLNDRLFTVATLEQERKLPAPAD
jgi:outer membrane lipoprotein-sorting protein